MIVIWIAAIVVFGIVEAVTVGLVSIGFVLGAVAGLLAAVLACGPEGSWNVTSQERVMIAAGGTDSVVRIPLEQAQELMLRYTGLALSDTQGVGLDSLRYLSEYNVLSPNRCRKTARWRAAACQEISMEFLRTAPAGAGQAVTCSTSGMGLRLK